MENEIRAHMRRASCAELAVAVGDSVRSGQPLLRVAARVSTPVIRTERLLLRRVARRGSRAVRRAQRRPARDGASSRRCSRARQSDALARALRARTSTRHGFGPWAVEVPGVAPFIGFVGLVVPGFEAHFTPCVEVGWRLARRALGPGLRDGGRARAARATASTASALDEIVSFTTPQNVRSQAVMQRIGMTHDPADDFDHPRFAAGSSLAAARAVPLARTIGVAFGYLVEVASACPVRRARCAAGFCRRACARPAAASRAEVVVELKAPPVAERAPLTQLRDAPRARRPAAPRPAPRARRARARAASRRAAAAARRSRACACARA